MCKFLVRAPSLPHSATFTSAWIHKGRFHLWAGTLEFPTSVVYPLNQRVDPKKLLQHKDFIADLCDCAASEDDKFLRKCSLKSQLVIFAETKGATWLRDNSRDNWSQVMVARILANSVIKASSSEHGLKPFWISL